MYGIVHREIDEHGDHYTIKYASDEKAAFEIFRSLALKDEFNISEEPIPDTIPFKDVTKLRYYRRTWLRKGHYIICWIEQIKENALQYTINDKFLNDYEEEGLFYDKRMICNY
jgi:hypothetical protein